MSTKDPNDEGPEMALGGDLSHAAPEASITTGEAEITGEGQDGAPAIRPTSASFVPTIRRVALARCVLAVARTRIEGAWAAYVDAVPGTNHGAEVDPVLSNGAKLREPVARVLFPEFEELPYAH